MNKSVFLIAAAGLFFTNLAAGATAPTCSPETVGKKSCIAGETMECVKRFDPATKAFKYDFDGVNDKGQAFDTHLPSYKKVEGFTPAPCDSKSEAKK